MTGVGVTGVGAARATGGALARDGALGNVDRAEATGAWAISPTPEAEARAGAGGTSKRATGVCAMGVGGPGGAAAARLAARVLACSAAASGAAMPDGAMAEADRPRAARAASCESRPDRPARRASAVPLASLFAGADRRSASVTASFTAAPASRGWKLSSVSRTGLLLFIAGKVPKCTAWAFAADPRPVRRCIKPSIEAAVSAGATIRTIRSAPGVSPFIAKINARARHAP